MAFNVLGATYINLPSLVNLVNSYVKFDVYYEKKDDARWTNALGLYTERSEISLHVESWSMRHSKVNCILGSEWKVASFFSSSS